MRGLEVQVQRQNARESRSDEGIAQFHFIYYFGPKVYFKTREAKSKGKTPVAPAANSYKPKTNKY